MIAKTLGQLAAVESAITVFACVALVLFVAVFVAMLLWTSRREGRELYGLMQNLPLEREGDVHE